MMRFISEDTYKGEPDDPMSLNLYAYCKGNPIRYVDPTGHDTYTATGVVDPYYGNVPGLQEFAEVTSFAIGFTPIDGIKDAADLVAGKDIITQQKTSRGILIACLFTPEIGDKALKSIAKGATNWKSIKKFGHTFNTHGAGTKNLNSLIGRAASTKTNQGQWLDNQKAAEFLDSLGDIKEPTIVSIPEGLGQVITPNGEILKATQVIVVPSSTGIKTAYPIAP